MDPRERSERGASAVELAMLTPLLIIAISLTIQFAMLYHARQVATAAAQAGARVARATADANRAGWQDPARQKAFQYLQTVGPNLLETPSAIPLVRDDGLGNPIEVGMRVHGTAVRVVPFLTLEVDERAQGPVERFVSDG